MLILPGAIIGVSLTEAGSTVLNDGSATVTYAYREGDFASGATAGTIAAGVTVTLYGTVYFTASSRTSLEITKLAAVTTGDLSSIGVGTVSLQARARTSDQVRRMLTNPPSAPQFTLDGALTGSVLTAWNATNAPFEFQGVQTLSATGAFCHPGGVTTYSYSSYRIAFDVEGPAFQISFNALAGGSELRVWVDECPSPWYTLPTDAADHVLLVDFSTRAIRRIVVEGSGLPSGGGGAGGFYFGGIKVPPTTTLWPPRRSNGLKIVHNADSYGLGVGATHLSTNHINHLDRLLGISNSVNLGLGGSGFVSNTVTPKYGDSTRLTETIATAADIVVAHGSQNDSSLAVGDSTGPIYTAVLAWAAAIRVGLPSAQIVLVGVARTKSATAADLLNHAELKAAATAAGITFIDTQTTPWFTGTGGVQNPTGVGNSDYYYNDSGGQAGHPSQNGHDALGRRKARDIAVALGIPVAAGPNYKSAANAVGQATGIPVRSGTALYVQPMLSVAANVLTTNSLRVQPYPLYAAEDVGLDTIFYDLGATVDAGTTFTAVVYADNGRGYPGALVTSCVFSTGTGNAGTVAYTANNTVYSSPSLGLTLSPGLYWVGGVVQNVSTTGPTIRTAVWGDPMMPAPALPASSSSSAWYGISATGVSGAVPSLFPSTWGDQLAAGLPRIGLKII